jgi:hypothetical protein
MRRISGKHYSLPVPVPVLAVLGAAGVVVALIVALQILERRRLADRDAGFARDAASRGWHYTSHRVRTTRTERWQGMGLGGPWTLEIVEHRGRKRPAQRITRWWNGPAEASTPAGTPVVLLVALGDEVSRPLQALSGDGAIARLAAGAMRMALDVAIGMRFGATAGLDGRALEWLDRETPIVGGYTVLADDPAEVGRRLTPARLAAIRQAFAPGAWDDGAVRHPWIAFAGDRVAIAGMSRLSPRLADVEALVQAGGLVAQARG